MGLHQLIQNLVWLFWISNKGLESVERSSLCLHVDFEIKKRFAGLVEAEKKEGRFLVIRFFLLAGVAEVELCHIILAPGSW